MKKTNKIAAITLAALAALTLSAIPSIASVPNGDYTTTAQSFLSLRTGAGTQFTETDRLGFGTKVTVQADAGDWSYVFVPSKGEYGYVYNGYLAAAGQQAAPAQNNGATRTVANLQSGYLAVRTAPEYKYENEIGRLSNGMAVQITGGYSGNGYVWVYAPALGISGWVNQSFIG